MQTKEYKAELIKKCHKGDIIGVRSETLIGKAIRFFTGNVNHSAILIDSEKGLLMEAALSGVHIMHVNEYIIPDSEEIYPCAVIGMSDTDKSSLIDEVVSIYCSGEKYDVLGIVGLAFRFSIQRYWWRLCKYINWDRNKLANSNKVWCSELIAAIYLRKNIKFTEESITYLTPNEIYNSSAVTKIV